MVAQVTGMRILNALRRDPQMQGSQVSVGTTESEVHLNGTVENALQAERAETIARQQMPGAKVFNHLEIRSALKGASPGNASSKNTLPPPPVAVRGEQSGASQSP